MYRINLRIPDEMKEELMLTYADMISKTQTALSLQQCIIKLLNLALNEYWRDCNDSVS